MRWGCCGDLDRLGVLSFDAWRAARLVVDTGIHALGWTRAEAEAFLEANTPLATNNIRNEVDRYITTPGQALAYKTGQLEIRRLRAKAEAARYSPGLRSASTSAPWPPIEWPLIARTPATTGKLASISSISSRLT